MYLSLSNCLESAFTMWTKLITLSQTTFTLMPDLYFTIMLFAMLIDINMKESCNQSTLTPNKSSQFFPSFNNYHSTVYFVSWNNISWKTQGWFQKISLLDSIYLPINIPNKLLGYYWGYGQKCWSCKTLELWYHEIKAKLSFFLLPFNNVNR